MELAEVWAAGKWVHLYALINQLPMASRTRQAYFTDPDNGEFFADEIIRTRDEKGQRWTPAWSEWDLHAELLTQVIETLRVLISQNAEKYKPKPNPRPRTSGEEVVKQRDRAKARATAMKWAPHAFKQ